MSRHINQQTLQACPKKVVASDKNHRPCLPLKPQEKSLLNIFN